MTERKWLTGSSDPQAMLAFLSGRASDRKFRLYAAACCRRIWEQIPEPRSRAAVEAAEQHADGFIDNSALTTAWCAAAEVLKKLMKRHPIRKGKHPARDAAFGAMTVAFPEAFRAAEGCAAMARSLDPTPAAEKAEAKWQCAVLRDLFGNPFRPLVAEPRWLTANVVELACTIYEERAFERMPILADALMDAGCDNEEMLEHCRGEGPHVRGCWVVDLVLGKG